MRVRWLLALIPCVLVAVAVMTLGPWAGVAESFEPAQPFEVAAPESGEAAAELLGGLGGEGRARYRSAQLWDAPFALANAGALLVLLLVPARLVWRRSGLIWVLGALPVAVLVGEGIENAGILSMLAAFEASGQIDPGLAGLGTSIKFGAFVPAMPLALLLWLSAGVLGLLRWRRGRNGGDVASDGE